MRILALSDEVTDSLYTPAGCARLGKVDLILGCGDLPYYYLEYLMTVLGAPLYYVHGNHDSPVEHGSDGSQKTGPEGGENVDLRCVNERGLLLAGLEGCIRYQPQAAHQFSQDEMLLRSTTLVPGMLANRLSRGRWLDVLMAHSPPRGIRDGQDNAHVGFVAFLHLMRFFRPRYLLHGHQHRNYGPGPAETRFHLTTVVNVHPYRMLELDL
jgi:Icc-related predicted phosphoesterase